MQTPQTQTDSRNGRSGVQQMNPPRSMPHTFDSPVTMRQSFIPPMPHAQPNVAYENYAVGNEELAFLSRRVKELEGDYGYYYNLSTRMADHIDIYYGRPVPEDRPAVHSNYVGQLQMALEEARKCVRENAELKRQIELKDAKIGELMKAGMEMKEYVNTVSKKIDGVKSSVDTLHSQPRKGAGVTLNFNGPVAFGEDAIQSLRSMEPDYHQKRLGNAPFPQRGGHGRN